MNVCTIIHARSVMLITFEKFNYLKDLNYFSTDVYWEFFSLFIYEYKYICIFFFAIIVVINVSIIYIFFNMI